MSNNPSNQMEGKAVPPVSFRLRENDEWKDVNSDELFNNKTVIVFFFAGCIYADLFINPSSSLQRVSGLF